MFRVVLLVLVFILSSFDARSESVSMVLDLDTSIGNQNLKSSSYSSGNYVEAQIFITHDVNRTLLSEGVIFHIDYDHRQLSYSGFKSGNVFTNQWSFSPLTHVFTILGEEYVSVSITNRNFTYVSSQGLIGTIRFLLKEDFNNTRISIGLVSLVGSGYSVDTSQSEVLIERKRSSDFDGDGVVGIPDFLQFVDQFGLSKGDRRFDSKFDLDGNGIIGIPDFLIFVDNFGKTIAPDNTDDSFNIELVFLDDVPELYRELFDKAVDKVESIITSDLEDIDFTYNNINEYVRGLGRIQVNEEVDDILVFVKFTYLSGDAIGLGGPLLFRETSQLPVLGQVRIDIEYLDTADEQNITLEIFVHELLHAVGFGTSLWEKKGLLHSYTYTKKFFSGKYALDAFNSVGGLNYSGRKVPVDSDGGHWSEEVFNDELMTGRKDLDEKLSIVTIQSLRDIGYDVDISRAEKYRIVLSSSKISSVAQKLRNCVLEDNLGFVNSDGLIVK